jgi:hypothetical protein
MDRFFVKLTIIPMETGSGFSSKPLARSEVFF